MPSEIKLCSTARCQFLNITARVQEIIAASGTGEGLCLVDCPHTTAGITVNEAADPDVVRDLLLYLERNFPRNLPGLRHAEGNSDAHLKAAIIGSSVTLPVKDGGAVLGTWQGIFFAEFDGPRERRCWVQVVSSEA